MPEDEAVPIGLIQKIEKQRAAIRLLREDLHLLKIALNLSGERTELENLAFTLIAERGILSALKLSRLGANTRGVPCGQFDNPPPKMLL